MEITLRATLSTQDDELAFQNLVDYCVGNRINMSVQREGSYVDLRLVSEYENLEELHIYLKSKYEEMGHGNFPNKAS